MVLPVRFPPAPGETQSRYIARLAQANDCSLHTMMRHVTARHDGRYPTPDTKLLADAVGIECEYVDNMRLRSRDFWYLLDRVRLPDDDHWRCCQCETHGIPTAAAGSILRFACTTHRCLLTDGSTDTDSPGMDRELLNVQTRINDALDAIFLTPHIHQFIPKALQTVGFVADILANTDDSLPGKQHPRGAQLGRLYHRNSNVTPLEVAEIFRIVWPAMESQLMRSVIIDYLDRFRYWRANHPNPALRGYPYSPAETYDLWNTLELSRIMSTLPLRAHEVPTMFILDSDPWISETNDSLADEERWRNRGIACLILHELLDDVQRHHDPRHYRSQKSSRRSALRSGTDHQIDVSVNQLPALTQLVRHLQQPECQNQIGGALGISALTLATLIPQPVESLTQCEAEMWLWMQRAHGTTSATTLPFRELRVLMRIDAELVAENKIALLDHQDRILAELSNRAAISSRLHARPARRASF